MQDLLSGLGFRVVGLHVQTSGRGIAPADETQDPTNAKELRSARLQDKP